MRDPLLEDAEDRATIAISVHATMVRIALGTACVFAVFAALHTISAVSGDGRDEAVLAADVCALGWSLYSLRALRRSAPDIARSEWHGVVLIAFVTVNSTLSAWLFAEPRELFYQALLPMGLGAVTVRRWPWRVVTAALCAVAVTVAAVIGGTHAMSWALLTMVSSTVIAAAIHAGRRSSFAEIVQLHRAERTRAARERELADQLRHVQKLDAIGTLAGGIAHDINNVLAAIQGVAELGMEDHGPETAVHGEFGQIMTAAQRGAALTRNLLGFARRGKHRHERVVVSRVVDEVLALLARTAPRRIRFERADEDDMSEAAVMGDPGQLSQVLMNLCLNAVDAIAEHGTVLITLAEEDIDDGARATLKPGRYLRLQVRDTGAGMTAETLEHAFEPFYSTKNATHRSGSGLGLAMVYGTVRDHLGAVTLRSTLGVGTTASIWLPACAPEEHAALEPSALAPVVIPRTRSSSPRLPTLVSSRPVLVIDDEELVRRVCTRLLHVHDVATNEADGGRAGLAMFRADPRAYSMVLLDLAMPEMTGAECFRELRAIDSSIPIVLMSGFPKDQSVDQLMSAGRTSFLAKPFARSALLEALMTCGR